MNFKLLASEIKFQVHLDLGRVMQGKCNTLLSCRDHASTFLHLWSTPTIVISW